MQQSHFYGKKIFFVLSILLIIFLGGCSTKNDFEPTDVVGDIDFAGILPAPIKDVGRSGATLKNGQIITKSDGLLDVTIPLDHRFVAKSKDLIITTSKCGNLNIYNTSGSKVYSKKYEKFIASANVKDSLLAIVFADNSISLTDMKNDQVMFEQKLDDVFALDARIANPYFLNDLIVYPSLDGRLLIVEKKDGNILRDIVVSDERFFNNVMFLDVLEDKLMAATGNRIISISPKGVSFLDMSVKDVVFLENRVFVLSSDGKIVLANSDLNVLKETKYKFAKFSTAIFTDFLYVVEKSGYIVAVDKNLVESRVYKMPDPIETFLFAAKETIYYDDGYFTLSK